MVTKPVMARMRGLTGSAARGAGTATTVRRAAAATRRAAGCMGVAYARAGRFDAVRVDWLRWGFLSGDDHAGWTRPPAFLSSSMAEHPAVNRRVVGSSPT